MTTLVLSLLFVAAVALLPIALARTGRAVRRRAVAVAAVGGRDLEDVVTYTRDGVEAACLLMMYQHNAEPAFVRRVLCDVVAQLDAVERASRLRGALGEGRERGRPGTWPELLLWSLRFLDATLVARVLAWRGRNAIADLRSMSAIALEGLRAVAPGQGDERFVSLFADDLARLGLAHPARPQHLRGGLRP